VRRTDGRRPEQGAVRREACEPEEKSIHQGRDFPAISKFAIQLRWPS
jgi:hypothetical protein